MRNKKLPMEELRKVRPEHITEALAFYDSDKAFRESCHKAKDYEIEAPGASGHYPSKPIFAKAYEYATGRNCSVTELSGGIAPNGVATLLEKLFEGTPYKIVTKGGRKASCRRARIRRGCQFGGHRRRY